MNTAASYLWSLLFALGLLIEGWTLRAGSGTFSATIRGVLSTEPGKLTLYPFWLWLTYHFFFARSTTPDWRDCIVLALGIGVAVLVIHHANS